MSIWEVIAYVCFTIAAVDMVFMIILIYRHRDEIRRKEEEDERRSDKGAD